MQKFHLQKVPLWYIYIYISIKTDSFAFEEAF